jgi:hypothetical protein
MKKNLYVHPRLTKMVGRTRQKDIVWRTDNGPLFIIPSAGADPVKLTWWQRLPTRWGYRRSAAPHMDFSQAAVANEKGKHILKALRKGSLKEKKGFLYGRDNRPVMTRAMASVVLHWLDGCGVVIKRTPIHGGYTLLDLDVDATQKNRNGKS